MPSNNFKVGEMLNKRTPNTKTWMNFDGSYTTEIHSGIVHFDDGLNNLHNINTSLFDEADADSYEGPVSRHGKNMLKHEKEKVKEKKKQSKMNRDDFDYQVPTLPFSIQIPKNIKKGYSIGQNDEFVRFIPHGVSPSKGYVNKTKNNEIQYQDAWNDTDIILEVTDRGIKETMVLKTDRAPFAFSFEVQGVIEDDLTMGNMKLEPAWLVDAVGEKRDVSQTIRREGEQTFIDLVADVDGLVYPIEIDPTVTIQPDGTAGKDTFVRSTNSTQYQDTSPILWFGRDTQPTTEQYYTLMQFDVSSIPSGAVLTSGLLTLIVSNSNQGTRNYSFRRITADWTENAVVFSNMPPVDPIYILNRNLTFSLSGTWAPINVDILPLVSDWVQGAQPNHGFRIDNTIEGTWAQVFSSDHATVANRPKLSVTYNMPPSAPTVTSPNGGETWNSSHTVTWNPATDSADSKTIQTTTLAQNIQTGTNLRDFGQVITMPETGYVTKIYVITNAANGTGVSLELTGENGAGSSNDVVYESKTNPVKVGSYLEHTLTTPKKFNAGEKYVIRVKRNTAMIDMLGENTNNPYSGGASYFYSVGNALTTYPLHDVHVKVDYSVSTIQSDLKYQIQLSTDNGTNWSDIVTLTTAGATSYVYDFINKPQTSTAKIRIRAYDGSAYGPWDESNGVFSIIHNVAPTAPTNLTPVTTKDRAEVIRFAWQHNDPNSDAQSKFDLDYRLQGAATWNTVTQNTINQFYDLPADLLPRGTIEWRVRTYDQADLSGPYSELKTFFAGDKPSKPTTLNPVDESIVSVSNPTVEWSSVGQVGYNLKVLDATETSVLWETNQTSNNKAHTVGYSLENETEYVIQLSIKNVDGINSNVEESHIHVSYTPPAIPIVTSSKEESALVIEITNPMASGTEPNVSYNSVFRREKGDLKFIRIATNLPDDGTFIDYTVASGHDYEYQVRAFGDNGTFRDSLINTYAVSFENVRLNLASQPNLQVELKFNGERSFDTSFQSAQSQFAGRKRPVTEFGIMVNNNLDLNYVVDPIEIEKLTEILYKRETLLYRDSRGRKFYVTAENFSVSDDMEFDYYEVALPLSEVDYTEEV